ncbi:MAG: Ig-like domain-containing protein [Intrasporangium sp.]|uniref:Ig-like domain-containing protein n=1 Tax=Intrasporangium sp. TaxID=1925024 RepID=UPI002648B2F6|nr:Ig-like domain-containing protein [Intrasporangium sp.]MDN5796713.1 Ig-like domain-containing protein [Intrasporangium sp.]
MLAIVVGSFVVVAFGGRLTGVAEASPVVVTHFPATAATNVSAGVRVTVVFDRPLTGNADRLKLTVADAAGDPVSGAVRLDESLTAAELEPTKPLAPGTYTAQVTVPQVISPKEWSFTVPVKPALSEGPGGPILLVTSKTDGYDEFYAEMLRAEGLTGFHTIDTGALTSQALSGYRVVIASSDSKATAASPALREWVMAGGQLVVARPTGALADLAGLRPVGRQVTEGRLAIATSSTYGSGLTSAPLRVHGAAEVVRAAGDVDVVATIAPGAAASASADSTVSSAAAVTTDAAVAASVEQKPSPAVTVRSLGDQGGTVSAFTFDLAKSVVLTRQGNPDWAGQDRDGLAPIRPNDLFFGDDKKDPEPDYLDLDQVAVPQADEQMRILSNIIERSTAASGPMPRWWYFPDDAKAVLVMAADDHGTQDGTRSSFRRLLELSPKGCDLARWECPRATAFLYPTSGLTDQEAVAFEKEGFDLGVHVSTHCQNWSDTSLDLAYAQSLHAFKEVFPGLPPQHASRLHCIAWSQYTAQPTIERRWGIRLDMNYYYWPGPWVANRSGFMTGSGLPMRFSDTKGNLINVYQQETHLVDEVFTGHPKAIEQLIDRAQGPDGYYGAFGTHYDFHDDFDDQLMQIAEQRHVPMISAQQLLTWTDGRSKSTFEDLRWADDEVSFHISADKETNGALRAMLPVKGFGTKLTEIRRDGKVVQQVVRKIKGIDYAFFDGTSGDYVATYR